MKGDLLNPSDIKKLKHNQYDVVFHLAANPEAQIAQIVIEEMGLKSVKLRFTGGADGGRGWKGDVKNMLPNF